MIEFYKITNIKKNMRTIKFRGKQRKSGEWLQGDLVHLKEELVAISVKGNGLLVIPESVGQFTGYLDKDGNEICEGDILEDKDGNHSFYIAEWEDDGFVLRNVESKITVGVSLLHNRCGVIGNIHETENR